MTKTELIKACQRLVGVEDDGIAGPVTWAAIHAKLSEDSSPEPSEVHRVKASSFADPADIMAFKRCKAQGKSDRECFKVGDNGIGTPNLGEPDSSGRLIGVDTTQPVPMCALPPEDWLPLGGNARGAKVRVEANGKSVICELRDTMPRKANIKNGAGIDLNPAAGAALMLTPPFMVSATWQWA